MAPSYAEACGTDTGQFARGARGHGNEGLPLILRAVAVELRVDRGGHLLDVERAAEELLDALRLAERILDHDFVPHLEELELRRRGEKLADLREMALEDSGHLRVGRVRRLTAAREHLCLRGEHFLERA